ncbi:MAG TPA: hypothetical protein VFL57_10585 [Bryobacteraceae bacterium]|nr:hypothetical protein [Bryobacteraceae bacterium]
MRTVTPRPGETRLRLNAVACALAALAVSAICLWLRVAYEYDGNVTGLYYTGETISTPPQLAGEHIRRIAGDRGYDAQFYHYVAHDPLLTRGLAEYVDNPRLRWRRILVPGLAYTLASGNDDAIDLMYVAVMLAFAGLGAYWLGLLGERAWLGLGFLLIPAVLISLDRMTVDLPLAALCIAFVLHGGPRESRAVYAVLAAAPLVRETGLLLIAGWCVWTGSQRRWRQAVQGAACAVPALGWWTYVQSRTAPDQTGWLGPYPFAGLIQRTLDPPVIPRTGLWMRMANLTEQLALVGIWAAFAAVLWILWKRRWTLAGVAAVVFAAFSSLLGKYDIWADAYASGRVLSPLLVLLVIVAIEEKRIMPALPMLLILPRVLLQYYAILKRMFS